MPIIAADTYGAQRVDCRKHHAGADDRGHAGDRACALWLARAEATLVFDVLKNTGLIQADDDQRWTLRADVKESVRRCLNPSLPQKFQALADEMRIWASGQTGGLDGNGWHERFVPRLTALLQKARDHGEDDAWFDKVPSHHTAVTRIADALVRVGQRLPEE